MDPVGPADFTQRLALGDEATAAPAPGATAPLSAEQLVRLSWPLPRVALSPGTDLPSELLVNGLLGEGGMGKVLSARQVALDREVAVKVLRGNALAPEVANELLREALVTGQLEHPNIVPVYLLGQDEQGRPFFAMKRIEGVAWLELIRDPAQADARAARHHRDRLELHLDVFQKVCDAMAFAHARGIVHRDLKPANVMLGAFGEVYVLDWGIAVSLRDDARVPKARDVTQLAGTPAYLAPEMADCRGAEINERTDVYLLGAMLHEVLTGRPRHGGQRLAELLQSARESAEVAFGPEVPAELAALCNKALRRDPAERFGSVEDLRAAVADFLRHRHSRELQAAAEKPAAELERLLGPDGKPAPGSAGRLEAAFAACRFGYEQALQAWPQNPEARAGLQQALERMIECELHRQNPGAAQLLLHALPEPRPALAARVEALARELESQSVRLRELERFRREADLDVAIQARSRVGFVMAAVWGPASVLVGQGVRRGWWDFGYPGAILCIAAFNVMAIAITLWLRRQPFNQATRRLLVINVVGAASFLLFWLAAAALHIAFPAALTVFMLLVASNWATLGLLFDRRAMGVGLAFLAFGLASGVWPAWRFELFGGAVLTGFGGLGLAWRRPGK